MKKIDSNNEARANRKATRTVLIALGITLLIVGIILVMIEPIKRMKRKKISTDALNYIELQIEASNPEEEPQMTYVVPRTGNEVEGEGYDFGEETEEVTEEEYGGTVTLNSIGILNISAINCRYSVWDTASQVSLRYGLGHYVDSVMPGEIGNATILGHNYRDGSMFHKLGNLKAGDAVKFTRTDGIVLTFYVTESKIISADDLLDYASGNITTDRQLTLVTCTYEYGRYGWRRVVICKLSEDCLPYVTEETAATTESAPAVTQPEPTAESSIEPTDTIPEPTEEPTIPPPETTPESTPESTPETTPAPDEQEESSETTSENIP